MELRTSSNVADHTPRLTPMGHTSRHITKELFFFQLCYKTDKHDFIFEVIQLNKLQSELEFRRLYLRLRNKWSDYCENVPDHHRRSKQFTISRLTGHVWHVFWTFYNTVNIIGATFFFSNLCRTLAKTFYVIRRPLVKFSQSS